MLPPDSFLTSSAHACSEGFSGCCGGSQVASLRSTCLSCASAVPAYNANASMVKPTQRGPFIFSSYDYWNRRRASPVCAVAPDCIGAARARQSGIVVLCGGSFDAPRRITVAPADGLRLDRARRRAVLHQHPVPSNAALVRQRGFSRLPDRRCALCRRGKRAGRRELPDYVFEICLAAFVGRAIT